MLLQDERDIDCMVCTLTVIILFYFEVFYDVPSVIILFYLEVFLLLYLTQSDINLYWRAISTIHIRHVYANYLVYF